MAASLRFMSFHLFMKNYQGFSRGLFGPNTVQFGKKKKFLPCEKPNQLKMLFCQDNFRKMSLPFCSILHGCQNRNYILTETKENQK